MTSIDKKKFTRLGRLYLIGLSAIALSVIISQIIIRNYLREQQNISTLIDNYSEQKNLSEKQNQLVYEYNREALDKLSELKNIELLLMSISLLVLLIVFATIFWPAAKTVNRKISQLINSEKKAMQMARSANILKNSKEKSIQELSELTRAIDKTLLFARVTSKGAILHLGDKFLKQFNLSQLQNWTTFPEIISIHKDEQQNISTLLTSHSRTGWQGEIKATTPSGDTIWLEMHMIPFFSSNDHDEIIIISSDITTRKKAHLEVEELTKKNFEEKMNQQKIISRKIIESQEKEQNRIAKDIHDGIGQMLTGLKFNIESIDLKKNEETAEKVEQLKTRTADIIQGVRTATFNLTPPELSDYGITSALSKLTNELSRLTEQNITFFNKSDFDLRLDPTSEINIYRIVQEAINNAIKYAQASYIIISLSHSDNILSISIDDDGVGFIPQKEAHKKEYGGMGMMFMQERIKYVKGRIFINSMPDKGTRITLNIPIK